MELSDVIHKTCLIGLSYFDTQGEMIKQSQLGGRVIEVDAEEGISIELQGIPDADKASTEKTPVFKLPSTLSAWFVAPPGHYRNAEQKLDILNPDYLVTWDIHKTQKQTSDGEHEWWEWVPRTAPPQVGS